MSASGGIPEDSAHTSPARSPRQSLSPEVPDVEPQAVAAALAKAEPEHEAESGPAPEKRQSDVQSEKIEDSDLQVEPESALPPIASRLSDASDNDDLERESEVSAPLPDSEEAEASRFRASSAVSLSFDIAEVEVSALQSTLNEDDNGENDADADEDPFALVTSERQSDQPRASSSPIKAAEQEAAAVQVRLSQASLTSEHLLPEVSASANDSVQAVEDAVNTTQKSALTLSSDLFSRASSSFDLDDIPDDLKPEPIPVAVIPITPKRSSISIAAPAIASDGDEDDDDDRSEVSPLASRYIKRESTNSLGRGDTSAASHSLRVSSMSDLGESFDLGDGHLFSPKRDSKDDDDAF